MKKLVAVTAGTVAAVSMALINAGNATSDGPIDVSGEPYAKAVALLKAQGYKAVFGGSVGSAVPQAQCVVSSVKVVSNSRISLMLDCTEAAQPEPESGAPTVGSNGIITLTPTPVPSPATPAVPPPPPPG